MTTNPIDRSGPFLHVIAGLNLNEKDIDSSRP